MRQIYYYRLGSIAARLGCYAVRAGLKLRAAVALPPIFTINYALYCRSCRALLETVGTKGYALLDLHAPETLAVYPAREGTECAINGYTAVVHRKTIAAYPGGQTEVVEVLVTGG